MLSRQSSLRVTTIALAVAAAAIVVPAAASASTPTTLSADGHLQPMANFNALHIVADGQDAGGTVTGTYAATGDMIPISVSGPVTCLDVEGNTASLVYPITAVNGMTLPGGLNGAAAVQVTVTKGANGQPNQVGIMGPMATTSFNGCAPGPTPFTFDGTVSIDGD
ncbi:hypothetical protein [Speluncibacter jeojiensis]|uniref:Uncharacterized protein n=1 Tax=Speluncibacter jeojiensis TaxID=2710754 RepID=A0A9X4LZV2_9ACTN|nr:hypothetical protein [Corynebacteriales bacterium D3-21]